MNLNLLEQLKSSPIGKQLESEFQSETLKKRQAAAGEIKRIVAHLTKVLPGLLEAREKAKAEVEAAQQNLQKSRKAFDAITKSKFYGPAIRKRLTPWRMR